MVYQTGPNLFLPKGHYWMGVAASCLILFRFLKAFHSAEWNALSRMPTAKRTVATQWVEDGRGTLANRPLVHWHHFSQQIKWSSEGYRRKVRAPTEWLIEGRTLWEDSDPVSGLSARLHEFWAINSISASFPSETAQFVGRYEECLLKGSQKDDVNTYHTQISVVIFFLWSQNRMFVGICFLGEDVLQFRVQAAWEVRRCWSGRDARAPSHDSGCTVPKKKGVPKKTIWLSFPRYHH